jgi:hypothetical protein
MGMGGGKAPGMSGGGAAPTTVYVPSTPDTTASDEAARQKQLKQAAAAQGRQSTILTSGLGATGTPDISKKQLLGA